MVISKQYISTVTVEPSLSVTVTVEAFTVTDYYRQAWERVSRALQENVLDRLESPSAVTKAVLNVWDSPLMEEKASSYLLYAHFA